jgi:ppGpp synthetase/RelA/SpoT-type nucleotidyltranferase
MNVKLSPHGEALLEEYRKRLPLLEQLSQQVYGQLSEILHAQGIEISAVEHRVKTEPSLIGKLALKGDKYHTIDDVTDLVGLRIITFYTDDVDKVAAIVNQLFVVDWNNSVDKRKMHQLNSFGYISLHYICRLKEGPLSHIPFELQMRTALQHVWSAIEHDIGYKSFVKLPPEFRRQFSRLAGMLELADDEFSRLRTTMTEYRRQVQTLVKTGKLDEVPLSSDSFQSYLELRPFQRLNQRIAAVNQAEVYPASLMPFLPLLESFHFETLGDVQNFIDENSEDAYQLALAQLAITDLDILSETVGLQNLCIVYALKNEGYENVVQNVLKTFCGDNPVVANWVLEHAIHLPFLKK